MTTMNTEAVSIRQRLQQNLEDVLIIGSLCNRNYEGVINSLGDKLFLGTGCDAVTVKDYDPAVALDAPQEIGGEDITLAVDHGAYFNIKVDDATHARDGMLTAATKSAAAGLAKNADEYILGVIREGAGKKMTRSLSDAQLYTMLLEMKMAMDSAGVPRQDRKLILPPYLETVLLMDERFITGTSDAANRLREGSVARACGFDIYISNDLGDEMLALTSDAVTFACEIPKVGVDGDTVVGLCLSGAKVVIPGHVVACTFSENTAST